MKFFYSFYHWLWSFFGAVIFLFPSRKLFVVGVTGTKGKSSTIELMSAVFEEAGFKTAIMSSVRRKIGDEVRKNDSDNSMPGRFAIQYFLWRARRAGCSHVFVEVTSQGVLQHRHRFILWDAAVFLDLAPEHIEAHGSFERYREAKVDFFRYASHSSKPAKFYFINNRDEQAKFFERVVSGDARGQIFYPFSPLFLEEARAFGLDLASTEARRVLNEWFFADFNTENALQAASLARSQNIPWEVITAAFHKFGGVPGRMEFLQREPFGVVIDYAHTPDSLERVYKSLRTTTNGRLICVLGSCGGGRDQWKRPVMGKIAGQYCELIILTNEDPYDENPKRILADIRAGVSRSERSVREVIDRKEAIKLAIEEAQPGDVVVVTGKGSESWIHEAKGKRIPWSERDAVRGAL